MGHYEANNLEVTLSKLTTYYISTDECSSKNLTFFIKDAQRRFLETMLAAPLVDAVRFTVQWDCSHAQNCVHKNLRKVTIVFLVTTLVLFTVIFCFSYSNQLRQF